MKGKKKQLNKGDNEEREEKNETRIEGENTSKSNKQLEKENQIRTTISKKLFLENFGPQKGVISRICAKIEIDRSTFYEWMKTDPDFKSKVEEIQKRYNDEAEDVLRNLVFVKQDPGSVKFYLRSKHPDYKLKLTTEIVATGNKTAKEVLDEFDKEVEEYEKRKNKTKESKTKNSGPETKTGVSISDKRQEGGTSTVHSKQSTELLLEETNEKKSDSESSSKGNIKGNRRRPIARVHSERY